jgi:hypothetical protein
MIALKGAISLKELLQMPVKQYMALRKAIDLVTFENRIVYIHDTSMSFSDPKKAITQIEMSIKELVKRDKSNISWKSDKSSIDRAKKKWMR